MALHSTTIPAELLLCVFQLVPLLAAVCAVLLQCNCKKKKKKPEAKKGGKPGDKKKDKPTADK